MSQGPKGRWSGRVDLSRRVGDDGSYTLDTALEFRGTRWRVAVLPGFKTDGASVPVPLRCIADPYSGRYVAAAIIHDALYATRLTTRAEADGVFREAMAASGVGLVRRWAMYAAVRLFGRGPWLRKTFARRVEARDLVRAWRQGAPIL